MQRRHLLGRLALTAVALAATAGLSACGTGSGGGDEPSGSSSGGARFPVTVGDTTVEAQPKKIVSMSATGTETLYAIGAGGQVAAVDTTSNYPAETPSNKISAMDASAESIAAFSPDLVVLYFDPGNVAAGLKALGIPVYLTPAAADLDQAYAQISDLGELTGHASEADALVTKMKTDIAQIIASAPKPAKPVATYYESDDTYYSLTSATFVGSLLKQLGLDNIADAADPDGKSGGYPQLSAEYILDANPAFILLADTKCCGQSLDTVAARPGWDALAAVQDEHVAALDDDIASRWGPRVPDLLRAIVAAMPGGN